MRAAMITTVVGTGLALVLGTGLSEAKDERRSAAGGGARFELEIDAELDARFGPRRVNAVRAAAIVAAAFPGARVTEAELDERDGGPIWEMTFELAGDEREVDVDADTGALLRGDD